MASFNERLHGKSASSDMANFAKKEEAKPDHSNSQVGAKLSKETITFLPLASNKAFNDGLFVNFSYSHYFRMGGEECMEGGEDYAAFWVEFTGYRVVVRGRYLLGIIKEIATRKRAIIEQDRPVRADPLHVAVSEDRTAVVTGLELYELKAE